MMAQRQTEWHLLLFTSTLYLIKQDVTGYLPC